MGVASDPAFDALSILAYGIKDVETHLPQAGKSMLRGGHWALQLNEKNTISVNDTGDPKDLHIARHLTWSVLRDGLQTLNDFVNTTDLAHDLRGLEFGINSAFVGQVGEGVLSQWL